MCHLHIHKAIAQRCRNYSGLKLKRKNVSTLTSLVRKYTKLLSELKRYMMTSRTIMIIGNGESRAFSIHLHEACGAS